MASAGSRPIVNGSSRATAMVELSPGSAPITTPRKISAMLSGSKIRPMPARMASASTGVSSTEQRPGDSRDEVDLEQADEQQGHRERQQHREQRHEPEPALAPEHRKDGAGEHHGEHRAEPLHDQHDAEQD